MHNSNCADINLRVYYGSDEFMAQVIPGQPRVLAFVWASGGDNLDYQIVEGISDAIWCHGCIVETSKDLNPGFPKKKKRMKKNEEKQRVAGAGYSRFCYVSSQQNGYRRTRRRDSMEGYKVGCSSSCSGCQVAAT